MNTSIIPDGLANPIIVFQIQVLAEVYQFFFEKIYQ